MFGQYHVLSRIQPAVWLKTDNAEHEPTNPKPNVANKAYTVSAMQLGTGTTIAQKMGCCLALKNMQ